MLALRLLSEGGEGPNTELLWLMYVGIAFFLLVIVAGWWSSARKQAQPAGGHSESAKPVEKDGDDLSKIEGVGAKVVKVLQDIGISSFDDLAAAKPADVQKALNQAGLQMINSEGWIEQAKAVVKEDWKTFEKLQNQLKGGRRPK